MTHSGSKYCGSCSGLRRRAEEKKERIRVWACVGVEMREGMPLDSHYLCVCVDDISDKEMHIRSALPVWFRFQSLCCDA